MACLESSYIGQGSAVANISFGGGAMQCGNNIISETSAISLDGIYGTLVLWFILPITM